jgi:hypothetical protein
VEVELCASSVSSYVSRRQCVVVYGGGRCSSGGGERTTWRKCEGAFLNNLRDGNTGK